MLLIISAVDFIILIEKKKKVSLWLITFLTLIISSICTAYNTDCKVVDHSKILIQMKV